MAYGLYNPSENYNKPKFWLAKPNKEIVSRLKEIDVSSNLKVEFGKVNELNFTLPFYIEKNRETIENPHVELLKNKYLIKMNFRDNTEWFIIEQLRNNVEDEKSTEVTAYSLQYELNYKKIYEIDETSILPDAIFKLLLDSTGWKLGEIDSVLASKHRSYNISNTSTLDGLYQVAETLNGILSFDTNTQTVSVYAEDTTSEFSGLVLNDKNYIESLADDYNSESIVTRLYPIGSEGLTINTVNPTGTTYLENFSYYLYPFKRDANKNILQRSLYMSDSLAHAILDYQEKIDSIKDAITTASQSKNQLSTQLFALESELTTRENDLDIVNDRLDIMKANGEYYYREFTANEFIRNNFRAGKYFVQFKTNIGTASIKLDGYTYAVTDQWKSVRVTRVEADYTEFSLQSDGLNGNRIYLYFARIPESETTWTDANLQERYNDFNWESRVESQKTLIESKKNEIKALDAQLTTLREGISLEANFTPEQLKERDRFINVEYWIEENHVDAKELYEDAVKQFDKLNSPSRSMTMSIFNFLNSLEDKRNWEKLKIGSKLYVKYNMFDISSEAILVGIDYDFAENTIGLSISDTKDLMTDEEKLVQTIYKTSSSANSLALKKYIYDDNTKTTTALAELLAQTWDANQRRITAGVNESIEIGKRGIIIRNPNYPNDILVAQAGVLAISSDNGKTFKNALTTQGLVAELIFGRVILGEKLWIEDDKGVITLQSGLIEIKDTNGSVRVKLGQYGEGQYGLQIYGGALKILGGLPEDQLDPAVSDKWNKAEELVNQHAETINTVLLEIGDESITNKVISSENFAAILDKKAGAEAIGELASKEELQAAQEAMQIYADNVGNNIDFSPYVRSTELEQTKQDFDFSISRGGGVNLIKNSVGYANTDFWAVVGNGIVVVQGDELESLGFGSGFFIPNSVEESTLTQTVYVVAGQTHTISWYVNKPTLEGKALLSLYDGTTELDELIGHSHTEYATNGYIKRSASFVPSTNTVTIKMGAIGADVMMTGLMMNIGNLPFQWTMAHGEIYNTNVRMDMNGVKVLNSEYDGYTQITPKEFSGFARVEGKMERIFSLNGDVTEVSKIKVEKEIAMNPIKIIPIQGEGFNGWAWVKNE